MQFTQDFKASIHRHYEQLSTLSATQVATRPAPDKWSPIEIIGHLIDSACNNHRRFVKAQWQEHMVFDGYQQAEWVDVQQYHAANWGLILDLWKNYNLHICQIMENTSPKKLETPVKEHNLHLIAMRTVPKEKPVTLGYFMKDYIFHIEHHLKQIYYLTA